MHQGGAQGFFKGGHQDGSMYGIIIFHNWTFIIVICNQYHHTGWSVMTAEDYELISQAKKQPKS